MDVVRRAKERLYTDTMTVYTTIEETVNNVTENKFKETISDEPCRLSHKTFPVSKDGGGYSGTAHEIKIFCAPELLIPPGSEITVKRQNGYTETFSNSGAPAMYSTHQEITFTNEVRA